MSISIVKHFQLQLRPKMGLKFVFFGGLKKNKDKCCDPARKSIPTETRHPVQQIRRYPQKMCSLDLGKKSIKRTHFWTLYFTPLPRQPCWADLYHFWQVGSHGQRNHPNQTSSRLIQGFGTTGAQNLGFSIDFDSRPYNSVTHYRAVAVLSLWIACTCNLCLKTILKRLSTALDRKPITELQSVACDEGSRTCNQIQVNASCINRHWIFLPRREWRLS